MSRFLFLALGMGMLLPTAAKAESAWLVLMYSHNGISFEKIPMKNMDQCEKAAAEWKATKVGFATGKKGYACLEGK